MILFVAASIVAGLNLAGIRLLVGLWKTDQYPANPRHIGEQIKKRRFEPKMPACECQNLLAVDQSTLTRWERGEHEPLNNPPAYPRYNGAEEKSIRDLKEHLEQRCVKAPSVPLQRVAQIETSVHELNHRLRPLPRPGTPSALEFAPTPTRFPVAAPRLWADDRKYGDPMVAGPAYALRPKLAYQKILGVNKNTLTKWDQGPRQAQTEPRTPPANHPVPGV